MALTEFQRQVYLGSLEGRSVDEIAVMLGSNPVAVREALKVADRWAREGMTN